VSAFEEVYGREGCLQCWADLILVMSPADLEEWMKRDVLLSPAITSGLIPPPDEQEMAKIKRSGRREARLISRLALLEPHECGKGWQA
jgi:hypothetical protein